jgi:hypothetical protein
MSDYFMDNYEDVEMWLNAKLGLPHDFETYNLSSEYIDAIVEFFKKNYSKKLAIRYIEGYDKEFTQVFDVKTSEIIFSIGSNDYIGFVIDDIAKFVDQYELQLKLEMLK